MGLAIPRRFGLVGRRRNDDRTVSLLTRDEIGTAVESTIASTGFSVEDLRAQALTGDFANDRARVAWDIYNASQA